jgi:hypothetical protein
LKQNKAALRSGLCPANSTLAHSRKNAPPAQNNRKPASMLIQAIRYAYNRFLSVKACPLFLFQFGGKCGTESAHKFFSGSGNFECASASNSFNFIGFIVSSNFF